MVLSVTETMQLVQSLIWLSATWGTGTGVMVALQLPSQALLWSSALGKKIGNKRCIYMKNLFECKIRKEHV